ncbi:hypothetical protein, partial [Actinomyces sp. oral taxon 172]|uniref:hypothetical protein n=1 Tax=Actinomyces sp. oral taxon 172 TaxID=712118 RepID=UPI000396A1D8
PSAKRCIKTQDLHADGRDERSPSEIAERQKVHQDLFAKMVAHHVFLTRQKAPSAKRRIKTR